MWVCGEYKDVLARLIKEYKFEHVRSASGDLAHMLHSRLPVLKPNTIITYVPTASSRVRMRGFDHAQLLAKQLAKKRATLHAPLLGRTSQARQLGNSRLTRQVAIQGEFFIKNQSLVKNADILLVDDVITTGATVIEAARVLKQAGARSVWVAVIAQTML